MPCRHPRSRAWFPESVPASPARHRVRRSRWPRTPRGYDQSVAVLHHQIPVVTQLGFLALAFPCHLRLRVRLRCVCLARPLLPVEVHRRIARIVPRNVVLGILALITLQLAHASSSVPSTVKCSSESRLRCRACWSTAWKKASAMSPSGKRSRFLMNTVTSQTESSMFKPTHRVQRLQQERSQQLLRRNRGPSGLGVQAVQPRLQPLWCFIGHGPQRTQRVVLRNSLLGTDVTEHVQLLLIFPRMPSSYQVGLRKQESFLVLGQLTLGLNMRRKPRNRRPTPFVSSMQAAASDSYDPHSVGRSPAVPVPWR